MELGSCLYPECCCLSSFDVPFGLDTLIYEPVKRNPIYFNWVWDEFIFKLSAPQIMEQYPDPIQIEPGESFPIWVAIQIGPHLEGTIQYRPYFEGVYSRAELKAVHLGLCHREVASIYVDTIPCTSPAYIARWENIVPNEKLIWSETVTLEDLIGLATPGFHEFAFVVTMEYLDTHHQYERIYTQIKYQLFGGLDGQFVVRPKVVTPAPPPEELYPRPLFQRDLCYFPISVTPDEIFTPVFVVQNIGEAAGTFYLGYWYLGEFHELFRDTIGAGEAFTYRMENINITEFTGPVTESMLADIRFYTGYIEEGVDPIETHTDMLSCSVYVTVEAPPEVYECPYCEEVFATKEELEAHIEEAHPEEVVKRPWWPFAVGGALIAVGATVLVTRRGKYGKG